MRINTNIAALNSYNQLKNTQSNLSKSLERLSSGKRINGAADDAAGLAISEKMKGQINGLNQAQRNAQDGISMMQTAEGALKETHSILQRMRELSVQAANDTNTAADRAEIQKEIDQLVEEIDRIGNTTEFNTKELLNGGAGLEVNFDSETVNGATSDWISVTGGNAKTSTGTDLNITEATAASAASTTITVAATAGTQTVSINGTSIQYTATGTASTDASALATAVNAADLGITAAASGADLTLTTDSVGSASELSITAATNDLTAAAVNLDTTGADASITSADLGTDYVASGNTIEFTGGNYEGLTLKLNSSVMSSTAASNDAQFDIDANNTVSMQIGANKGQTMSVSVNDMRAEALGVNAIDVSNATNANEAISTISDAIAEVSSERSKLGAYQNRLEHTINNLNTAQENLTAAESRISDVDMAREMMSFTKNQILSQAGTAMLAQANQLPQGVLQLLG